MIFIATKVLPSPCIEALKPYSLLVVRPHSPTGWRLLAATTSRLHPSAPRYLMSRSSTVSLYIGITTLHISMRKIQQDGKKKRTSEKNVHNYVARNDFKHEKSECMYHPSPTHTSAAQWTAPVHAQRRCRLLDAATLAKKARTRSRADLHHKKKTST